MRNESNQNASINQNITNNLCFVTQEEIPEQNKVTTKSDFSFDIFQLIKFNNARMYRNFEKEHGSKVLINPFTNERFSDDDANFLLEQAKQKNIVVNLELTQPAENVAPTINRTLNTNSRSEAENNPRRDRREQISFWNNFATLFGCVTPFANPYSNFNSNNNDRRRP